MPVDGPVPPDLKSKGGTGYLVCPGFMMVMSVLSKRHRVHDLIEESALRAQSVIDDARVNRVLNLLSEQYLATAAAEQSGSQGLVTIESVDLPYVREDERVLSRIAELEQQGIGIDPKQIDREVAGMTFKRWVICVRY